MGMRTGVALKPGTEVPEVLRRAIHDSLVDLVLIMTVGMSMQSQALEDKALWKHL